MNYKPSVYCDHANEAPYDSGPELCKCPPDCACRKRMCRPGRPHDQPSQGGYGLYAVDGGRCQAYSANSIISRASGEIPVCGIRLTTPHDDATPSSRCYTERAHWRSDGDRGWALRFASGDVRLYEDDGDVVLRAPVAPNADGFRGRLTPEAAEAMADVLRFVAREARRRLVAG